MAKVATTISLEEHTWDLIQSYMNAKKLSNRNTAIEWIILEHNLLFDKKDSTIIDGKIFMSSLSDMMPDE